MKDARILKIFLVLFYIINTTCGVNSPLLNNKDLKSQIQNEIQNCGQNLKDYSHNIKNLPKQIFLINGHLLINSDSYVQLKLYNFIYLKNIKETTKNCKDNIPNSYYIYESLLKIWAFMNEKQICELRYKSDNDMIYEIKTFKSQNTLKKNNIISFQFSYPLLTYFKHIFCHLHDKQKNNHNLDSNSSIGATKIKSE